MDLASSCAMEVEVLDDFEEDGMSDDFGGFSGEPLTLVFAEPAILMGGLACPEVIEAEPD